MTTEARDAYQELVDCATKCHAEFVDLAVEVTDADRPGGGH